MSPRRASETRACWKSCHSWNRRSTGAPLRIASMLKAISSPTLSVPAITAPAPNHSSPALTSRLTRFAACADQFAVSVAR